MEIQQQTLTLIILLASEVNVCIHKGACIRVIIFWRQHLREKHNYYGVVPYANLETALVVRECL